MRQTDFQAFLSARHLSQLFRLDGEVFRVEIEIPNLNANPHSVWGDWGPMVTIELAPSQTIAVTYSLESERKQFFIECRTVSLLSPPLASERERFPFYLEICDESREVRFLAYLDSDGEFDHLIVKKKHPSTNLRLLLTQSVSLRAFTAAS